MKSKSKSFQMVHYFFLLVLAFMTSACDQKGELKSLKVRNVDTESFSFEWKIERPFQKLLDVHFISETSGFTVGFNGTLLVTRNGGQTWTQLNAGTKEDLYAVYFLQDGMTGWVAGEQGIILRTVDGGKSWSALPSFTTDRIHGLYFEETGQRGLALGPNGSVFGTTDSGKTWEDRLPHITSRLLTLVFFPESNSTWVVGEKGTIVSSTDGGSSWSVHTSDTLKTLRSIHFLPSEEKGWIAGDGVILRTLDRGNKWTQQTPKFEPEFPNINYIFFSPDGLHGFTNLETGVGGASTMHTKDGGDSWPSRGGWADYSHNAFHFLPGTNKGWVVGDAGRILKIDGIDNHWNILQWGYKGNVAALTSSSGGERVWMATTRGDILFSENSGRRWSKKAQLPKHVVSVDLWATPNGREIYALGMIAKRESCGGSYEGNLLFVSTDEGSTWEEIWRSPYGLVRSVYIGGIENRIWITGEDLNPIAPPPDSDNALAKIDSDLMVSIVSVYGGTSIISSMDSGKSWEPVRMPLPRINDVLLSSADPVGWAVGGVDVGAVFRGAVFRTQDGGKSWKRVSMDSDAELNRVDSPDNGGTLWAVGNEGTIIVSRNGGTTWQHQAAATGKNLRDLQFIDVDNGWVVGDKGTLLRTADGGKTWQRLQAGSVSENLHHVLVAKPKDMYRGLVVGEKNLVIYANDTRTHVKPTAASIESGTQRVNIKWQTNKNDDQQVGESDSELLWTIEYNVVDSNSERFWRPIVIDSAKPAHSVKGSDLTYSLRWNPSEHRIAPGTTIGYRVTGLDGHLRLRPTFIAQSTYLPWWERQQPEIKTGIIIAFIAFAYILICLILLWQFPMALFWIYENLPLQDLLEKGSGGAIKRWVPQGLLTVSMISRFTNHTRAVGAWCERYREGSVSFSTLPSALQSLFASKSIVLDAWVEKHRDVAKKAFSDLEFVSDRRFYIPLPVIVSDGSRWKEDKSYILTLLGEGNPSLLNIVGVGGCGKSSLAFQVARLLLGSADSESIIPILIREDTTDIVTCARENLSSMIEDELSNEIFVTLLRSGRLLIIVDGLSERSGEMQEHVRWIARKRSIAYLVITARRRLDFEGRSTTLLEPQGMSIDLIPYFVLEHIARSGLQTEFPGREATRLLEELIRLGEAQGGPAPITPMLATIFIKAYWAPRIVGKRVNLESVPEVIVSYIEGALAPYEKNVSGDSYETGQRLWRLMGRCSVGMDGVPGEFDRGFAVEAVEKEGLADYMKMIDLFADSGILRSRKAGGRVLLSFDLDPVAEYAYALDCIHSLGSDEDKWREWASNANFLSKLESAEGVIRALRTCIQVYTDEFQLPAFTASI